MWHAARLPLLLLIQPSVAFAQTEVVGSPMYGTGQQDKYGRSFATVGDLNGDGIEDVAVGAPQNDSFINDAGSVEFRSGSDPSQLLAQVFGENSGDALGTAMVPMGDVDGDLVPDLAVGAPGFNGADGPDQGRVTILSGATFLPIVHYTFDEKRIDLGESLANVGDRTGDGIEDLLVGAPEADVGASSSGSAFLLEVTASSINLLHRFDGDTAGESFGVAVVGLDDVNGDGFDELVIASPDFNLGGNVQAGRVQIFSGNPGAGYPLLQAITGSNANDTVGAAIDAIEDPDGSSAPCLAITLRGRTNSNGDSFAGAVGIYRASDGSLRRMFEGNAPLQFLGGSVTTVDDQDGDGRQDLLVGAPLDSSAGLLNHGTVDLVSSFGDGTVGGCMTRIFRVQGENAGDRYGFALGQLGDLDGDGCREFAWGCDTEKNLFGLESGTLRIARSRKPKLSSDQGSYVGGDTLVVEGLTYAMSPTLLLIRLRDRPQLFNQGLSPLPPTFIQVSPDQFGAFSWTTTVPFRHGGPYTIAVRSLTPHPAAKGRPSLVSDWMTRPVN